MFFQADANAGGYHVEEGRLQLRIAGDGLYVSWIGLVLIHVEPISSLAAGKDARATDRGRDGALICAAPPSEPDGRISRIRLSSQWFAP